jgi:hypothetical protein
MATLTLTQQASVRMYLGYPDIYRFKDVRLEGIITGAFSDECLAEIVVFLGYLAGIDAKISTGYVASIAGLKKADDVEFYQGQALRDTRSIGRMWVGRLSSAVGIPTLSDCYGTEGYPGDTFSPGGFGGGGRNTIPLG